MRTGFTLMYPLVSVVIPSFNRRNDLLCCLQSLEESSYKNMETIVVDNGSTDGTGEAVRERYPHVKLITLNKNTGVTGGRNAGAKVATGSLLLFLDNDVVVDKRMVETLVTVMLKDERIGLVGPIIYYLEKPKKVWAAGTSINMLTGKISSNDEIDMEQNEVQVLPAVIMVRREVLKEVGLFDDLFFAVYEDTDFCFRVSRAGYKILCASKAKAWHNTQRDESMQELNLLNRSYYIARNRIIFMKKHASERNFGLFLLFFMPIYAMYYSWHSLKRQKFGPLKFYWKGLFNGIKEAF